MKIIALLFCIFMGITGISLGLGTAFPAINEVARPLVCPDGELQHQKSFSNPLPGRTYIQAEWSCADSAGNSTPVSKGLLVLYAGTFYGLLMFGAFWLLIRLRGGKKAS